MKRESGLSWILNVNAESEKHNQKIQPSSRTWRHPSQQLQSLSVKVHVSASKVVSTSQFRGLHKTSVWSFEYTSLQTTQHFVHWVWSLSYNSTNLKTRQRSNIDKVNSQTEATLLPRSQNQDGTTTALQLQTQTTQCTTKCRCVSNLRKAHFNTLSN